MKVNNNFLKTESKLRMSKNCRYHKMLIIQIVWNEKTIFLKLKKLSLIHI